MKGRYLILTPTNTDIRACKRAWHTFAEVCRSLHRDGLTYDVHLNVAYDRPHILIIATGTPIQRKCSTSEIRYRSVPALRSTACQTRALEVEWFLPENQSRRNTQTSHWRNHRARYEELSAMTDEHLRAELEYWRELELLSGQRQHFKPGLAEGDVAADDEVAA